MKFFTKNELIGVTIILSLIFIAAYANFKIALRRSRDTQRRADLGELYNALGRYHKDFGVFPYSTEDGNIRACKPGNLSDLIEKAALGEQFDWNLYLSGLKPCTWGVDSLSDITDQSYAPYLKVLPSDPYKPRNYSYRYISNGSRFQLYAYLEGEEDEAGFNLGIVARNLACGEKICNFGRAFGKTPLEKSIEEYENELLRSLEVSKE